MDMQFCRSCAMPLTPENAGLNAQYCKHCTDSTGNLHPREYVQNGLAQFLTMLEPTIDDATAQKRAAYYMKAMPAWA